MEKPASGPATAHVPPVPGTLRDESDPPLHRRCRYLAMSRRRLLLAVTGAITLLVVLADLGLSATPGETSTTVSPRARELLERARQEVLPAENTATDYGVRFSAEGYQTLLSWHSQYRLKQAQGATFESLDLTLPCCTFGHPSSDETKNCGCGHHQALYGLSKRLLNLGYGEKAVQAEVRRWAAYFFPRETLEAALNQRLGSDPAVQEALDELRQKGGC